MLLKFLWITAFGLMMLSLLIMFLTLLDVDVYKYLRGTARIIGALLGQIFYRLPRFLLRKIFMAIPWAMAACAALTFGVFAIGRQFFSAGDAKIFLEQQLPPRPRERTFSLLTIELMILFNEEILLTLERTFGGKLERLKNFMRAAYDE